MTRACTRCFSTLAQLHPNGQSACYSLLVNWKPLILCAVIYLVMGVSSFYVPPSSAQGYQVFVALLTIIALSWWLQTDSKRFPDKDLGTLRLTALFIAIIGLALYLIRTRGIKQGLISSAAVLGFFVALQIVWQAGWIAAGLTSGYGFNELLNSSRLF